MKLSQLESLVKAMRKQAKASKIADPNVEFYDDDRASLVEAVLERKPFINMDILDNAEQVLQELIVRSDGFSTVGDYAIPLIVTKN